MKRLVQKMFRHFPSSSNVDLLELPVSAVTWEDSPPPEFIKTSNPADVFLTEDALSINEARLCHLASLGLDIAGKRVLEVGGGIGLHTCFFESLGCEVLFTDARSDNLAEARRRYPNRMGMQLNLDLEKDLSFLGRFDIIYCYGTLYHLSRPADALKSLAEICDGVILLETCVTPGSEDLQNPEMEPSEVANQAASGIGCRPTRQWVMQRLAENFGHAYQTVTQPQHHDFECNWLRPAQRKLYRAVFVGSKFPLPYSTLSSQPCTLQRPVPDDSQAVWLDVGAHLGETTFENARKQPNMRVYAFEPNLELASQRFNQLPNYSVLPLAVGERDGFSTFHINSVSAASSLLPLDESRRQEWIGGETLKEESEVLVPTTRLDSFLNANGIDEVDYLKVDAQGADIFVIRSLGERLKNVRKIKLEVTTTATQLYVGGASKEDFIKHLVSQGFALISEQTQTHGQEENLVFFQIGPWSKDFSTADLRLPNLDDAEWLELLRFCNDEQLLALAQSLVELRPLGPSPGWYFGGSDKSTSPAVRLRKAIWVSCNQRQLQTPINFPWHADSKLKLHLGNDASYPTFIEGCMEPNEFAFMDSFLRPGMVFIDIGANEGLFSVFASHRVGATGKLISFEPSQRELQRLQANLSLNQMANYRIEALALAEAKGTADLRLCEYGHEGQNTLGDFAHEVRQDGTQSVQLCSLDEYLDENPIARLDFIKIDVEGAEQRVLKGSLRTLSNFKPVILMELNEKALQHQGASCQSLVDLLRNQNYTIYNFCPRTGLPVVVDGEFYSDNVIAVPSDLSICG